MAWRYAHGAEQLGAASQVCCEPRCCCVRARERVHILFHGNFGYSSVTAGCMLNGFDWPSSSICPSVSKPGNYSTCSFFWRILVFDNLVQQSTCNFSVYLQFGNVFGVFSADSADSWKCVACEVRVVLCLVGCEGWW